MRSTAKILILQSAIEKIVDKSTKEPGDKSESLYDEIIAFVDDNKSKIAAFEDESKSEIANFSSQSKKELSKNRCYLMCSNLGTLYHNALLHLTHFIPKEGEKEEICHKDAFRLINKIDRFDGLLEQCERWYTHSKEWSKDFPWVVEFQARRNDFFGVNNGIKWKIAKKGDVNFIKVPCNEEKKEEKLTLARLKDILEDNDLFGEEKKKHEQFIRNNSDPASLINYLEVAAGICTSSAARLMEIFFQAPESPCGGKGKGKGEQKAIIPPLVSFAKEFPTLKTSQLIDIAIKAKNIQFLEELHAQFYQLEDDETTNSFFDEGFKRNMELLKKKKDEYASVIDWFQINVVTASISEDDEDGYSGSEEKDEGPQQKKQKTSTSTSTASISSSLLSSSSSSSTLQVAHPQRENMDCRNNASSQSSLSSSSSSTIKAREIGRGYRFADDYRYKSRAKTFLSDLNVHFSEEQVTSEENIVHSPK